MPWSRNGSAPASFASSRTSTAKTAAPCESPMNNTLSGPNASVPADFRSGAPGVIPASNVGVALMTAAGVLVRASTTRVAATAIARMGARTHSLPSFMIVLQFLESQYRGAARQGVSGRRDTSVSGCGMGFETRFGRPDRECGRTAPSDACIHHRGTKGRRRRTEELFLKRIFVLLRAPSVLCGEYTGAF